MLGAFHLPCTASANAARSNRLAAFNQDLTELTQNAHADHADIASQCDNEHRAQHARHTDSRSELLPG